jgi:hypothetical protein
LRDASSAGWTSFVLHLVLTASANALFIPWNHAAFSFMANYLDAGCATVFIIKQKEAKSWFYFLKNKIKSNKNNNVTGYIRGCFIVLTIG